MWTLHDRCEVLMAVLEYYGLTEPRSFAIHGGSLERFQHAEST